MNKLEKSENYSNKNFEAIKHIDKNGVEYWYARELQIVLDYKEWIKFEGVVQRAMKDCKNSDINTLDHFAIQTRKQEIGEKEYSLLAELCQKIYLHQKRV